MRQIIVAAVISALCLAHAVRAQQRFTVFASVADAAGNPVATLATTDVRVQDAGVDAKVVAVEPINWPTKLQVLVDNGAGIGAGNFQILREALRGLLEVLPESMEVTLVTTAPQPRFLVRATADRKALTDGLGRLSPDEGTGRFVESLSEAAQRVERDKSDHFPVIITVGTTIGDTNVLDRDANRIFERLRGRPAIVHVVLVSSSARSVGAGANQTQVGLMVAKVTSGRYENIAAVTRLNTLLPELGKQVAASHEKQSKQFRLTVERPASAKGELDQIGAAVRAGLVLRGVSMDGRQP
jgi:hypothetical protein